MGSSTDPRNLNEKIGSETKYNYVPVTKPNTDVFMYTQPPFMSPKV